MKRSITIALLTFLILVSAVPTLLADVAQDQKSEKHVSGITSGRAKSLIGVVLGVSSLIIGWRLKARSKNKESVSKSWAVAGMLLGLAAVVLSVFHLTANTGEFGTGGGKAGAILGLLVGVAGTALSGLMLRLKSSPKSHR